MSEADKMAGRAGSPSQPVFPGNCATINISSAAATFDTPSAIRCGGAGNLVVDTAGGQTAVTITAMAVGEYAGVMVTKVYAAADGTTATALTRYWV